jgi:hypothetical protein
MPSFNASPFAAIPQKLIPGQVAYLLGSWPSDVAPTRLAVSSVAVATDVCTLGVTVTEGNIPSVGSLITVQGTATQSGAANVTNVALTGVTINATTGVGTVTFALTASDVSTTADGGVAYVPQPELGETVANGYSVPVGLPYTVPQDAGQGLEAIGCEVNFPTLPTACVVSLQGAQTNTPSTQWQTVIANVVTVSAGSAAYGTTQVTGKWGFLRYAITGTSGSGKIVAKIAS